jgi:hypothetical protein
MADLTSESSLPSLRPSVAATLTLAAGDRTLVSAEAASKAGHRSSARELYLRASALYAASYHPIYGAPVDPRLVAAFNKQRHALDNGLALGDPPIRPRTIPFEGGAMPAYFLPAMGFAGTKRPTIIFTNGYDGTITDMLFASAVAASRRGYHVRRTTLAGEATGDVTP